MNKTEALDILTAVPLEEIRKRCRSTREQVSGRKVSLCSICNAKNGACSEDCSYCAQSGSKGTGFASPDHVRNARLSAGRSGSEWFSIVTSGRGITGSELKYIQPMISREKGLCPLCASMGIVDGNVLSMLKDMGVSRYHHNLETSENFFSRICTTHNWKERRKTAEKALESGLSLCSGGIVGMGESDNDRIDLAFSLRELKVHSIALNFYIKVSGAAVTEEYLTPEKMLRIISMFRLAVPWAELRICAGRHLLGSTAVEMFDYGVTGIMTGNLLTTPGSMINQDIDMIKEAGYLV